MPDPNAKTARCARHAPVASLPCNVSSRPWQNSPAGSAINSGLEPKQQVQQIGKISPPKKLLHKRTPPGLALTRLPRVASLTLLPIRLMSLQQFKENESLLTTQKHCPCIEFVLADNNRHGFHASQLLHYHLEPNDGASSQEAPATLRIAFATADVMLTGCRLDQLADELRDGDLLAVRALPARYANLNKSRCSVASITVQPIANDEKLSIC